MFQQFGIMPHEFRTMSAEDWAFDMEMFTSRADSVEKWREAAVKRLEERMRGDG